VSIVLEVEVMMRQRTETQTMTEVTIRRLTEADAQAVLRLVQLDSADVPTGDLLGAEIEGTLVAFTPIEGGKTVADPFSPTSELGALLELRATQLRDGEPRRRRRFGGLFDRDRSHPARPSAPAPPGGVSPSRAAPS
jgi:hypothetical protein